MAETRLMPSGVHNCFMVLNTLIYLIFKPLLRLVAVPYEAMVPEHTQYALFQLYCDLRANPIKDRHWFEVHARRLKPHTYAGWIALSSALLYILSGTAMSLCMLLSMLAGAIYGTIILVASAGVLVGVITGLMAGTFFATACVASFAATSAAVGYGSLASAKAVLGWASATLLPKPQPIFPDIPNAPHLRPVATPRAPVLPDPAPAVNPASPATGLPPPPPQPPLATSLPGPALSAQPPALQPAHAPEEPLAQVSVAQVYTPDALDPIVEDAQLEAALEEQVANARAVIGATTPVAGAGEDDGDSLSAASVTTPLDSAQSPLKLSPPPSISAVPQEHLNGAANGAKRAKPHHKQGHTNGKASPKGRV